jgi:peroxiredoxin Q/BCP
MTALRLGVISLLVSVAACSGSVKRPDGGVGLLPVGASAPDLNAVDANGHTVRLSEMRGHAAVVYFYPKDETPGCTKEACAFRDAWAKYQAAGVAIVGVSRDSEESHKAFREHHHLPFPLASDPEGNAQRAYGVPNGLFGITSRVSFLVGPDGAILRVWPDVDPALHADDVLAAAPRVSPPSPPSP